MSAIIAWFSGKLGAISLGAGLTMAMVLAKKMIPKYIGKALSDGLGKGMSGIEGIADPVEKELIHNIAIAIVKWAEYKIPERGQGGMRYVLAAQKLCGLLPFLKGRDADIAIIIENAVVAMDEELKKVK